MHYLKNDYVQILLAALIIICCFLAPVVGWGLNIVKFAECDFKSPYKAEIIRGIGIAPVPIIGMVTGYMKIEDGK